MRLSRFQLKYGLRRNYARRQHRGRSNSRDERASVRNKPSPESAASSGVVYRATGFVLCAASGCFDSLQNESKLPGRGMCFELFFCYRSPRTPTHETFLSFAMAAVRAVEEARMSNDECRKNDECRSTNDPMTMPSIFVIRISSFFRHSSFDIRNSPRGPRRTRPALLFCVTKDQFPVGVADFVIPGGFRPPEVACSAGIVEKGR